jgi:hypothetical protein
MQHEALNLTDLLFYIKTPLSKVENLSGAKSTIVLKMRELIFTNTITLFSLKQKKTGSVRYLLNRHPFLFVIYIA